MTAALVGAAFAAGWWLIDFPKRVVAEFISQMDEGRY